MACIICNACNEKKLFTYQATDFYRCKICGLIRTLPFPSNSQIIEHYKNGFNSGNYFTLHERKDEHSHIYNEYIKIIEKKVGLSGKKILDIGCFTGEFLDIAKSKGAITFGIELQKDAYEIANKKHFGRIQNCSFSDSIFDEKFDIITMFGLIEHVVNPYELLSIASRSLSKNGILVVQTPNTGSLPAKLLGKYWPPFTPIEHIHYFSKKNIKLLLERFGFTDIDIRSHYKKLSVGYVYSMLKTFGKEFHEFLTPIFNILPNKLKKMFFVFYVGEMIIFCKKEK